MRPTRVMIMVLVGAFGLWACGGGSDEPTETGAAASSATDWADGICMAMADVESSVDDLGTSLEIDLGSAGEVLGQVKDQVAAQADAVAADVKVLADAVTSLPVDPDPEVASAAADLQESQTALSSSVDALRAATAEVTAAETGAQLVAAVPGVTQQLALVRADATGFRASVQELATAGSETARAAFADADSCTDMLGAP